MTVVKEVDGVFEDEELGAGVSERGVKIVVVVI